MNILQRKRQSLAEEGRELAEISPDPYLGPAVIEADKNEGGDIELASFDRQNFRDGEMSEQGYEGTYWAKVVDVRLCEDFAAIKLTNNERRVYNSEQVKEAALYDLYHQLLTRHQPERTDTTKDFSLSWKGGRWRGQLYHCATGWMVALRQMPYKKPDLLKMGFNLEELISLSSRTGLVLFAGPTGAGKSTTMAGLVYELQRRGKLGDTVTIEDPIEYLYDDPFIQQREVGVDVGSFHSGIHEAMRQTPDTIVVGEIRHAQAAETAVQAGLTGHRVLATIHAESIEEACGRMYSLLSGQYTELFHQSIQGIVAQHLIRNANGSIVTLYEALKFDRAAKTVLSGGADSLPRLSHEQFKQGKDTLKVRAKEFLARGVVDKRSVERWVI